jgi:GNAT superfamily N-acetyltransferase
MLTLRPARPEDAALICDLTRELADYEHLSHQVRATPERISAALFGERPLAFCEIAEWGGQAAGFTAWFYNYSTFEAAHGIYLEDVFVRPAYRRRGVARALFKSLVRRCADEHLPRLEWRVLAWNAPAIDFFASLDIACDQDWRFGRLSGEALQSLGR